MKYKNQIIAGVIVSVLIGVSYLIFSGMFFSTSKPQEEVKINIHDTSIVSTTPQETLAKFIYQAGTMGDIAVEATSANLKSGFANQYNGERRVKSYDKVSTALVDGSPMKEPNARKFSLDYGKILANPVFYEVNEDSLKVSEPYNERNLSIVSTSGRHDYNAVDVTFSFDSRKVTFDRVKDASWDGTYTRVDNLEQFSNLVATLVQIDDYWYVYEVDNAEKLINARFSTWQGISPEIIFFDNDFENGKIVIEGFKQ